MILKIIGHKRASAIRSLLKYVQDHAKSKGGAVYQILHNVRSADVRGQTREFYRNEAYRKVVRRNTVYVRHEVLSFSPECQADLSNEVLSDIARHYLHLRGSKALAVGAIHNEGKQHYHIHLCVSGTEVITGKSTDIPKRELHQIKAELQQYYVSRYPELAPSAVRHGLGKEYLSQKEFQLKSRIKRKLKREEIAQTVRDCFEGSRTQNDFLEKLRDSGLLMYERKGIPQGVIMDNMKFRFNRMNIAFSDLPFDRRSEKRALAQIQKIRARQNEKDHSREFES
jgi:hypothetical protein